MSADRSRGDFGTSYQEELIYLRALAKEFADEYPEVDYLVSQRQSDDAVERLLQGSALMFARLRQRLDAALPEVVDPLFEAMWPEYIRPVPAATIVRFTAAGRALRQSQPLERGTPLGARPSGDRICPFVTTAPVAVQPLVIDFDRATFDRPRPAALELRLPVKFTGGATFDAAGIGSLRLQLGEAEDRPGDKYALYLWLAHQARSVSLRTADGERVALAQPLRIHCCGLGDDEALSVGDTSARSDEANAAGPSYPGQRRLLELFAFPDKFLAINVTGFEHVPKGVLTHELTLVFDFDDPGEPPPRLTPESIRLGCAPAINASASTRRRIPKKAGPTWFLIDPPPGGEILAVDRVEANEPGGDEPVVLHSFVADARTRLRRPGPCFTVVRRGDGVAGVSTYVVTLDGEGTPHPIDQEQLSVWVTTTDGARPEALGVDAAWVRVQGTPGVATFTNVTSVAPSVGVRDDARRRWRLLGLFGARADDLLRSDGGGLRRLLRTVHPLGDDVGEHMFHEVRASTAGRLRGRMVVPTREVEIDVNERAFDNGQGQIFLLGALLHRLLVDTFGEEASCELTVRALPSGRVYAFAGDRGEDSD